MKKWVEQGWGGGRHLSQRPARHGHRDHAGVPAGAADAHPVVAQRHVEVAARRREAHLPRLVRQGQPLAQVEGAVLVLSVDAELVRVDDAHKDQLGGVGGQLPAQPHQPVHLGPVHLGS